MSDHEDNRKTPDQIKDKTIEKSGYPVIPPPPAMNDLRFIVKQSLIIGSRMITELDQFLRRMKE
ncbi:MAG: hypothetical protein HGA46_00020 [Chlorobiaceae bacterium]|nr:hypothetical protein [Chlorobiaceae bacterium]